MTTNPQDLDTQHDKFLALTSVKAVYFTELCRRVRAGKVSEDEAATAILDLCRDNERLAVLAGKRAAEKAEVVAENATLRRDLLAERAQALRDALAAFDREAKGHVYIGGQKFRTAKLDDVAPAILAMIPEGE